MSGKGTTDVIFIAKLLQEKYLSKNRMLYFVFVNLENAFDIAPREIIQWTMRTLGGVKWLVYVMMAVLFSNNVNGSYYQYEMSLLCCSMV